MLDIQYEFIRAIDLEEYVLPFKSRFISHARIHLFIVLIYIYFYLHP